MEIGWVGQEDGSDFSDDGFLEMSDDEAEWGDVAQGNGDPTSSDFARVRFLRSLMAQGETHFMWALQRIASLCNLIGARGRSFKDELGRQGVIEEMITALCAAQQSDSRINSVRTLRLEIFNALSRSIFDHRENAALATNLGLLRATAAALHSSESSGDVELSEFELCCANNACGMVLTESQCVLESGIIPVLIRYAGGIARTTATGREIAIAALANLSNAKALCQSLIVHGAVEVLAAGLRSVDDDAEVPTVSYMQALSAVVKTVGRSALMGGLGSRFSTICENNRFGDMQGLDVEDDGTSVVFRVCGCRSSRHFDQAKMLGLWVDSRSARWLLDYLGASSENQPYPPTSSIYGTAWKVAQSVACMANGSAHNRQILQEEGVWFQVCECACVCLIARRR